MKTQLAAMADASTRFWSKVDLLGDCWEWRGSRTTLGYGRFGLGRDGGMEGAHRVAYALTVGPVPAELELDHLCRNPGCVNPAHLEPVTHAENCRRGIAAEVNGVRQRGITHCPKGHPYDEANTKLAPNGSRSCRECARVARRARYLANPEKGRAASAAYRARQRGGQ